jgi:hypothetical protein
VAAFHGIGSNLACISVPDSAASEVWTSFSIDFRKSTSMVTQLNVFDRLADNGFRKLRVQ